MDNRAFFENIILMGIVKTIKETAKECHISVKDAKKIVMDYIIAFIDEHLE